MVAATSSVLSPSTVSSCSNQITAKEIFLSHHVTHLLETLQCFFEGEVKLHKQVHIVVNPLDTSPPSFSVYGPSVQCAYSPQAHDGLSHLLAYTHVLSSEHTSFTLTPQKGMQKCNNNSLNINQCSHQIPLLALKRIPPFSLLFHIHPSRFSSIHKQLQ